jgi:hypothetical protein
MIGALSLYGVMVPLTVVISYRERRETSQKDGLLRVFLMALIWPVTIVLWALDDDPNDGY